MSAKIEPCPKCSSLVTITPSYGGTAGSGQTAYIAECKCGVKVDHLGMGTMRSAVSAWNRYARQYVSHTERKS